jgi:hypothetical protein
MYVVRLYFLSLTGLVDTNFCCVGRVIWDRLSKYLLYIYILPPSCPDIDAIYNTDISFVQTMSVSTKAHAPMLSSNDIINTEDASNSTTIKIPGTPGSVMNGLRWVEFSRLIASLRTQTQLSSWKKRSPYASLQQPLSGLSPSTMVISPPPPPLLSSSSLSPSGITQAMGSTSPLMTTVGDLNLMKGDQMIFLSLDRNSKNHNPQQVTTDAASSSLSSISTNTTTPSASSIPSARMYDMLPNDLPLHIHLANLISANLVFFDALCFSQQSLAPTT